MESAIDGELAATKTITDAAARKHLSIIIPLQAFDQRVA
jgi:hypothetical protein